MEEFYLHEMSQLSSNYLADVIVSSEKVPVQLHINIFFFTENRERTNTKGKKYNSENFQILAEQWNPTDLEHSPST